MGISRSTYYRRRKQARERAAVAVQNCTITRAEAFTRQLQRELAEVARCQAITAEIIGELLRGTWRDQRRGTDRAAD
jgi:transposase-like protein